MKKSQIHMGETIAVLIIFFFLLVPGAAFYMNYQHRKAFMNKAEIDTQTSIKVAEIVSYLPELQCSSDNIVDDNCYDLYKLQAANSTIYQLSNYYYPLLRYSEIKIQEIYPENKNWVLYNKSVNGERMPTNIPISLYDPATKRYSFGVLTVVYIPFAGNTNN